MNPPLECAAVAELPDRTDPRWSRWLSPLELAYCHGYQRIEEHLAARLLGKAAVIRALGWPEYGARVLLGEVSWHEVEIRRAPLGPPQVVLTGGLADWASARGLGQPGVSLSHAGGYAAALAWLPGDGGPR